MRRMRVGIYHHRVAWNEVGGIAVFYRKIGVALAEAGHQVVFYSSADEEPLPELDHPNVRVVGVDRSGVQSGLRRVSGGRLPPYHQGPLSFWLAVLRSGTHRRISEEVDVLLTSLLVDDLLISRVVDVPVVYQFHGNLSSVGVGGRLRDAVSGSETLLANSWTTADRLSDDLGIEANGVVYPGVDLAEFTPPATEPADPPEITFAGRLDEEKGVQDLIRAFAGLEADARLNVVGDGAHRDRFERLVADLGVDGVTFHGKVPREEFPSYYHRATVACHPSHHESFGMTNVEAMAAGTPLVTTDLPAVKEYAVDGENCRIVPVGDPAAIRSALDELLSSPALRESLARGGRETAERFGWDRQASRLEEYCRAAVEGRTPRPDDAPFATSA